jgi:hypothetical protein
MIDASTPRDRIDLALIMQFLVHKKAGVYQVKRYRNQIAPLTCVLDASLPVTSKDQGSS